MTNEKLQTRLSMTPTDVRTEKRCTFCKYKRHIKGKATCTYKYDPENQYPCAKAYNSMKYYEKKLKKDENKTYNRNNIKDLLLKNRNFVARSIEVLYERQTLEEQRKGITFNYDNVGFSRNDIPVFKEAYDMIKRGMFYADRTEAYYKIRYRLFKYCQQLADIANKKLEDKQL